MSPAQELTAAADKLDADVNGECPCRTCSQDRALARILRGAAVVDHSDRMNRRRPNRVQKSLLVLARLINGGES